MEKARRQHVPAFGEWNYYYHYYDEPELTPPTAVAAECYAPEPETCSDVWFKYSPPPRKPASKKARRPDGEMAPEKARRARALVDAGGVVRAPAKGATSCRVVRPVDEDLYQVPPPEFVSDRPRRKRAMRSLWMGCLGLNCIA